MSIKDLCLQSIDHCKMFAPIAEEMGIEPDGYWTEDELEVEPFRLSPATSHLTYGVVKLHQPTWRQDKLELPLPDWVWQHYIDYIHYLTGKTNMDVYSLAEKCYEFVHKIINSRGEDRMQATVELVCLLKGENLIPSNKGELGLVCPDCCKPIKGYAKCECEL